MRSSKTFLLCLWLFQLAPEGAWAQTISVAGVGGVPVAVPSSPASLDPNIASLLRDPSAEPPFNVTKNRLPDTDLSLLTQNNYRLQPDGTVLPPYSDTPVGRSEMTWLIQELSGRQKLKALLQLNLIFNQYGYKNIPENALADVRRISRQNWAVLPKDVRSDLRQYFTAYELDTLNQHLPALKSPTLWLNPELPALAATPAMPKAVFVAPSLAVPPPAQAPVTVAAAPAPATSVQAASPALAAPNPSHSFIVDQPTAQPKLQAVLPSQFASLPLPRAMAAASASQTPPAAPIAAPIALPAPTATTPPISSPAAAVISPPAIPAALPPAAAMPTANLPLSPAPVSAASLPSSIPAAPTAPAPNLLIQPVPKPQPAEPAIPPSVASAIAAATAVPAIGVATTAITPPHPNAVAPAPTAPAAVPPPPQAPAAPEIGEYPDISREAANKFLADAPYGHEVTDLLKLIADHAPDDLRRPAFGVLARFLPQIVTDPARSGESLRVDTHKLSDDPYQAASTLIVLNRGPMILRERNLIFHSKTFLMPTSQEFYNGRGVTLPAMQALSNQNPPLYGKDIDWGKMEEYSDGSERLKFSREEMAGTLLYQLLKLDSHLRHWDVDLYRTELRSRSAQFRFYYKLHQDTQMDMQLSLDLKTEYRQWLERPDDYMDFVLQTLAAPKVDQMLSSMSGTLEQRSAWSRRHDLSVLSDAKLTLSDEAQKLLSGPPPATPDLSEQNAGLQREIQALNQGSSIGAIWLAEEQRFREESNAKH